MSPKDRIDLGSVQIHKKVLAEIVASIIHDISGVNLPKANFCETILRWLGSKRYPGIAIKFVEENSVVLNVWIKVKYGMNIPSISKSLQNTIVTALEKTASVNVKTVNINILGIERGN